MAEGMISSEDKGRGETLRDCAERYLFELANRCMVQVKIDETSVYNRFKSCRLHDLIRDLSLSKEKKRRFLEVMDREMGREESSICKTNRLAIHLKRLDNDHSYSIGENKNIRSLLFLPKNRPLINLDSCITFGIFKYLKVLVLEGYVFENGNLPKGIEKLKLLKLLSLEDSYVNKLPPSICKLPCLQTLNVKRTITLPNYIYKMRRLRHLFLRENRVSSGGGKLKLKGLNELETITGSIVCIKLRIDMDVNMNSEDGSTLLRRIDEDPMEILEKLPMLRELNLSTDAYVGREMVCGATGFPQLRKIILEGLPNLVEWRVEKGAMPDLSTLEIRCCRKLKMMPDGLKFITSLKKLSIVGMREEFEKRMRVVNGEEGEDYHKIKPIPFVHIYKD
ncbi:putative disease resistance protein [Sesamum angolense]|uniref:Disease resistance protein n=1 Tax=Sesamum angolense TaxID=2727404 RepID=A0AAE1X6Q9_9LAMI|nr:putative disease resistance protein [Sesamum angolense]